MPHEIKMKELVIGAKNPGSAKLFVSDPRRCSVVRSDSEGGGLVESVRACDRWVEHELCQEGPTLLVRSEVLVGVGRLCAQVLTQRGPETIYLLRREVQKQVLVSNVPGDPFKPKLVHLWEETKSNAGF